MSLEEQIKVILNDFENTSPENILKVLEQIKPHFKNEQISEYLQGKMQKMLDVDRYSIWYEQCTQCRGIWLDAGEFKKFKQNFQPHNLMNLTQIIFR